MDAAAAIRLARVRARLSKRELARRAGTSPAAIVGYEAGVREPTLPTLERIVGASGVRIDVCLRKTRAVSPEVSARRLAAVLGLAEHLPRRPAGRRIAFPPLPQ